MKQNTGKEMIEKIERIKKDVPSILNGNSENSEKLVKSAEELGKHLANNKLTTSQIRNIYSEVKQMRKYDRNKLNLLRPKMAYTAARHGIKVQGKLVGAIVDLQEVLDECIKKTNNDQEFENFKNFFEAILAYHRYHGGGD